MEIYSTIVGLINEYLIRGIFVSVLVIIISRKLFKHKINTHYPIVIIKWVLIGYAVLILLDYLVVIVSRKDSEAFLLRATGPYWFAFWLMLISNTLLPLSLLFRKLQYNIWYIFILTIFMNTGWLAESLIIHTISMHRDYNEGINPYMPSDNELFIILNGFFVGVIVMVIGNRFPKAKN